MSRLSLLRFITRHPLNRRHKLRAVRRIAQWQTASRPAPARFPVRRGDTGLAGNLCCGLHEFADSGANLGSCPRLAGAVVGARGYALEPIPRTFGRLLDKIRLKHPEGRVQAFWRGLAQAEGARPALLSASPSARPACRRGGKVVHFL